MHTSDTLGETAVIDTMRMNKEPEGINGRVHNRQDTHVSILFPHLVIKNTMNDH